MAGRARHETEHRPSRAWPPAWRALVVEAASAVAPMHRAGEEALHLRHEPGSRVARAASKRAAVPEGELLAARQAGPAAAAGARNEIGKEGAAGGGRRRLAESCACCISNIRRASTHGSLVAHFQPIFLAIGRRPGRRLAAKLIHQAALA